MRRSLGSELRAALRIPKSSDLPPFLFPPLPLFSLAALRAGGSPFPPGSPRSLPQVRSQVGDGLLSLGKDRREGLEYVEHLGPHLARHVDPRGARLGGEAARI